MQSNQPIQSWIPPKIDEAASTHSKKYEEVILSNQLKQDGFDKGYQEGLIKAEKENQSQQAKLKNFISDLSKIKLELIQEAECALSDIVITVAKKIINHELTVNKTIIEEIIREMLGKIPSSNKVVKIKVHPDNLETIKKIIADETDKEMELSVDASLSIGCIKVKSDHTKVEYNMDEIFDSVIKKILI